MQPDIQYMKHSLNTSTFRNTGKFSKASRFASTAKTYRIIHIVQLITTTMYGPSQHRALAVSALAADQLS
jgi:hypothetical protein